MKKIVEKVKKIINVIGKQNMILVVFILFVVVVSGLYKTFSIYTATDGVSFIEGIKTYKFVLQSDDNAYSVTVGANSSKYLAITVTNDEALSLLYGVYYSYTGDLSTLNIGYLSDSEYLPKGTINANSERVIKLHIDNLSSSDITITFGVKYGFVNGGALILDSNQYWFDEKITLLSSVDQGSWVSYVGDNGCSGKLCNGVNENFSTDGYGYCSISDYQFTVNGWRLAYTKDSIPYLISAGSPECICTNAEGTASTSCASGSASSYSVHILNLNNIASKYCNTDYASGGVCDGTTAWNFGLTDFHDIMTNTTNTFTTCYQVSSTECGKDHSLIDVGGMYWAATSATDLLTDSVFLWGAPEKAWVRAYSHNNHGIRPVLKLDSDVRVVGGTGTYKDPYRIASDSTLVEDLSGNGNHAVDYGNTWDKTAGTITTNNSYSRVDGGLRNYKFGDSVTMAIRVKFNSINADVTNDIFGNWETGGFGFELRSSGGYLQFPLYISGGYKVFVSTLVPELDTWYTLVGTYDGSDISLYVNGTAQTLNTSISTAVSTASGDIGVSSQPFYIGSNPGPGLTVNAPVDITVDSALIFERALTATEISENYSGVINPVNKADLLLYYDF